MKEPADVAVGRLFEEHAARLYRLGVRFCGNKDEAQDLVQDVFLQAFRKWSQFDGRSSPSTWLYTIAARRCQRRHRRRAGEPAAILSLSAPGEPAADAIEQSTPGPSPLDAAVREQLQDRVAAAVTELPATMRLPLVLTEIAGIPLADVARVLGLKLGTVKSRVHRARLAVRQRVADHLPLRAPSATEHDRRFCRDLLQAKQEALDRRVPFPVNDADLCEQCRSLFATLDLTRDVCQLLASGEVPPEVAALAPSGLVNTPSRRTPGKTAPRRHRQLNVPPGR